MSGQVIQLDQRRVKKVAARSELEVCFESAPAVERKLNPSIRKKEALEDFRRRLGDLERTMANVTRKLRAIEQKRKRRKRRWRSRVE